MAKDEQADNIGPSSEGSGQNSHIREVWAYNLEEEMDRIRDIADSYPYIAMVCLSFIFLDINVCLLGYGIPRCCCSSSWSIP
jgi:hypothetical protein